MTAPRGFAVIPAAGLSRRMGSPKLLLPWRDSTVIDQTLRAWRRSQISRVVIVVRPDDEALRQAVAAHDVELVVPPTAPAEMKDSIRLAIEHLRQTASPDDQDAWLLAPADMPWISPTVIDLLLERHQPAEPRILIPTYHGERGHPVLFPWSVAREVPHLQSHEGVNRLRERHGWTPLPVSEHFIHGDLDTPEDYEKSRRSG